MPFGLSRRTRRSESAPLTPESALLTPGPISDQSWNAGAYEGLMRIRDSLGAQVSHIQTRTPADFEENFRQYGAQGYDLVIGHGFEFQDAAERVAGDHPETVFIVTSGNRVASNVSRASSASTPHRNSQAYSRIEWRDSTARRTARSGPQYVARAWVSSC